MDAQRRIAELEAELAATQTALRASEERIAQLEKLVAELLEKLGKNSDNSHLPPSSDSPEQRRRRRNQRKAAEKKRKRGGQKGHKGSHRQLLPPERVDEFVDLFPAECQSCWKPLAQTADPFAKRYQHTELKGHVAHTIEYRRHAVMCPCGYKTRAKYDTELIPRGAFGPRLMATVVLLTGVYHLSRRQTVSLLRELLDVHMSTGSVSGIERRMSGAVEPAVDEAWESATAATVKHADGTTWTQAGVLLSLWTVATTAVTVFKILPDGKGETLRTQLLVKPRGILVSDRATALKFWAMGRRQICWAHLMRKFVSFSERDGPVAVFGQELLEYAKLVFGYWGEYQDGKIGRARFRECMVPVRAHFEALLQRAVAAKHPGLSGSCADILEHRAALWTFVDREGVEPTNNHAEREVRGFVLWRKRSFGSQSDRGNRFAERLMSVAHTARKQGREVLAFLTACAESWLTKREPPSLLAPA